MFSRFKRTIKPTPAEPNEQASPQAPAAPDEGKGHFISLVSERASTLGRDAAEVRGAIEDANKLAAGQLQALSDLVHRLAEVKRSQQAIDEQTRAGVAQVARVRDAVEAVGDEVSGIVDTLRKVSGAAADITQIALQTRLVAFNASVEAKRAGESGRGFGVVADAVKDLAARVEASSKEIMSTVALLDSRIESLAREIHKRDTGAQQGAVHQALTAVDESVARIQEAAKQSQQVCQEADAKAAATQSDVQRVNQTLGGALARTETFLKVSEDLIETTAASGIETPDTPYIQAAQQAARRIMELLEEALRTGAITESDLFDEDYKPIDGTQPAQHLTRFCHLADRLFPQVQDAMLSFSDNVVFCIAVDRNGYVACHNSQYNHPQRPGDVVWNTANSRYRRIFNDRTGLAAGRNTRPFLLQTYRRDMGGGNFLVMKEVDAPITLSGRHWGGLRLAFKF